MSCPSRPDAPRDTSIDNKAEDDLLRYSLIIGLVAGVTTAAWAQNTDVIAARQEIYKGFGEKTKPIGAMLKGDAPFDLPTVKAALQTYVDGTAKLPSLFPPDSKTGHDTAALPAIWDNKSDFEGRFAKLGADAKAALGTITDQASFTTIMPKVLGECGACHKEYRAKK